MSLLWVVIFWKLEIMSCTLLWEITCGFMPMMRWNLFVSSPYSFCFHRCSRNTRCFTFLHFLGSLGNRVLANHSYSPYWPSFELQQLLFIPWGKLAGISFEQGLYWGSLSLHSRIHLQLFSWGRIFKLHSCWLYWWEKYLVLHCRLDGLEGFSRWLGEQNPSLPATFELSDLYVSPIPKQCLTKKSWNQRINTWKLTKDMFNRGSYNRKR